MQGPSDIAFEAVELLEDGCFDAFLRLQADLINDVGLHEGRQCLARAGASLVFLRRADQAASVDDADGVAENYRLALCYCDEPMARMLVKQYELSLDLRSLVLV
jgi:hypothetical protein